MAFTSSLYDERVSAVGRLHIICGNYPYELIVGKEFIKAVLKKAVTKNGPFGKMINNVSYKEILQVVRRQMSQIDVTSYATISDFYDTVLYLGIEIDDETGIIKTPMRKSYKDIVLSDAEIIEIIERIETLVLFS